MASEIGIRVDEDLLALAVAKKIRPLAVSGAFEKDEDEGYHHTKVLPIAGPCLTEKSLREDPTKNFLTAVVSASSNLLAAQEKIWAKQMATHCDGPELGRYLLGLLYGSGDLLERIQTFQAWAALRPVPGTTYQQGCSHTVISYLLAMTDPVRYAFCKPTVYKPAALALLGAGEVVKDKAKRVMHATAFYTELLRLLRDKHELPFGDLLYVHAALFRLAPNNNVDSANWDTLREPVAQAPTIHPSPVAAAAVDLVDSDEMGKLLLERKNVIFYGPPGTGKTFKTLDLARKWRQTQGEETVGQVTFHPSYAYEDFIEGFRPADRGGFALRDGVFVDFCRKALAEPERRYLLVIDEINRGDVARLFGELITLIESDKRNREAARRLPYSKQEFWIPPNLYILGTMNTADRSISLLDIAIRRRFSFVEFSPDGEVFGGNYLRQVEDVPLADLLQGINRRLRDVGVDRDRSIGHSYFLIPSDAEFPLGLLQARLQYDVYPLIEEYCYADRTMIQRILGDLVDEQGRFDAELEDDEPSLLTALRKLAAME